MAKTTIEIDDEKEAVVSLEQIAELKKLAADRKEKQIAAERKVTKNINLLNDAIHVYETVSKLIPGLKTGNVMQGLNVFDVMKTLSNDKGFQQRFAALEVQINDYKKEHGTYTIIQKGK